MIGRDILTRNEKINVLLDSETFEELLKKDDRTAKALLKHKNSDFFVFLRTPYVTDFEEFNKISQFELIYKDDEVNLIKISNEKHEATMGFHYSSEDILDISKFIFKKGNIIEEEYLQIQLVFIQAVFNRFDHKNIFITGNDVLLKNRLWFENHVPNGLLNIMTIKEASEYLDLMYKYNEKYFVTDHYRLDKGLWYWHSMRLKIPHFNVGDPYISALATRATYVGMALDEIGMQFYKGVNNNNTMDNMLYHFNYIISLFTGIFDNLALKTNNQLGINFTDLRKVSLNNDDFLKEIKYRDIKLRVLIANNRNFIRLIYKFREFVIHREGLETSSFHEGGDPPWKANFITISEKVGDRINGINKDYLYDPFTIMGYYSIDSFRKFLEPYHFSKEAVEILFNFVDGYLELLGFTSFIEEQRKKDDDYTKTMNMFEKYHLGI